MKIFSIAAVALLVDISVSFHLIDDDETFGYYPKIPILNSKFGMKCQTNNLYNAETIKQKVDEAHNNVRSITRLEQGTFTRFPGVVLYSYFIGQTYDPEQDYHPSNYILIDSTGSFVAGMKSCEANDQVPYRVCMFTGGTDYTRYG
ncbi:Bgt_BCG-6 [Blumeria graminis f. sp. tritici]|uniref:Bgt_BCG-6 n=2 Tax=Blumeria graminis f. sp. tritici TaxID=62690 RepID=A0A061HMY2_BLUGR|nr:hypothetical protein BGT96224_BCG6 [Blumeria graminis f. sp. tritici 96224]VCU41357.1 Bgt_BCG-6 [Blumeria graminis f. sp. tritici]